MPGRRTKTNKHTCTHIHAHMHTHTHRHKPEQVCIELLTLSIFQIYPGGIVVPEAIVNNIFYYLPCDDAEVQQWLQSELFK